MEIQRWHNKKDGFLHSLIIVLCCFAATLSWHKIQEVERRILLFPVLAKANSLPTPQGICRHVILIGVAFLWSPHSDVELLPQVLSCPHCRPQVPHSLVVQWHQDRRPSIWINLYDHEEIWDAAFRANSKMHLLTCTVCLVTASTRLYRLRRRSVHFPEPYLHHSCSRS